MVSAPPLIDAERDVLQQRTLRVLTLGQVAGAGALGSAVTVGAFVVEDIIRRGTGWAGIATATVTTGTAVMAQVLSRRMSRTGRRPGLGAGYLLAAVGALGAAAGAQRSSLPIFLAGLFLFGTAQASNLLSRYAAVDLARPHERGKAMSRIVFASTAGAVLGPSLIGPFERAGEHLGLHKYTGPWLFSALFLAVAAINVIVRLRPDPLVAAGGLRDRAAPPVRLEAAFRTVIAVPAARLALLAMTVSQATMVAIMAMAPVHLRLHGHEGVSQFVVSLHIAGMYAFSPLVGRFTDRRGRLPAIQVGAALLVVAAISSAGSGDVEQLLFPSLWLLGLGWNFGLIAGSSLLIESVDDADRVPVQGAADLLMSLCGAAAGFASGFIRRAIGFHLLAAVALLGAGVLFVAVSARRRAFQPA